LNGANLRKRGLNRIGNLLVPNDNYCKFEDWMNPILDQMLEEQKSKGKRLTMNARCTIGAIKTTFLYIAHR